MVKMMKTTKPNLLVRKDAFMRHKREMHFDANANIEFVEDLASLTSISCASCGSTFKRKSDLKRHQQTAHAKGEIQQFKCSHCEKTFSRKFAMNRHLSTFHK